MTDKKMKKAQRTLKDDMTTSAEIMDAKVVCP